MLLDDVMNRAHTTGVCASPLRELRCARVFLLVLAPSESSLQSSRYERELDSQVGSEITLGYIKLKVKASQ